MKKLKKILSVLTLIVLVGSDFLTSFSYAIEEIVENTEVIQTEMGEIGENEGKTLDQSDETLNEELINHSEDNYEEEKTEEETENMEILEEISQGNEETLQELSGENIDDEVIDDKIENTEEEKSEIEVARETLNENVIEKSEKYNDVVVNLSAKEGTFPKGTYVDIEAVRGNQLEEVRQQISDENNNILEESEIVAFDIKFLYKLSDETEIELQPKNGESVKVSFDYSDNTELGIADKDETKEIQVYHINDKDESGEYVNRGEEKVEKIEINQKESENIENGVVIDAEKFSVYALVLIESGNPTQYTLTLDPGEGSIVSGENITINEETGTGTILSEDGNVTLPLAVRENHEFLGWYTVGESFAGSGGDSYEITGNITLYAKWQEDEGVMYTVTFDANRGTFANLPTPQTVVNGSLISAPTQQQTPELSGYTFTGWWTEPRDGTQWDFAKDVVTGNITLYAHWTYNEIFGELDVYMIDSNKNLTKKVMMDRNLGASARYDRLDFTNPNFSSLGFAYQWGNNWGFTRCANNTLCHGEGTPNPDTISQAVSDWIGHVPSKYASKKFHGKNASNYAGGTWISNNNGDDGNDLWGLETGTPEARQGPCPDGYYLPSGDDYNTLYTKWKDIRGYSKLETDDEIRDFTEDFLFPLAGSHKKGRFYEYDQGLCADYWTNSLGAKVNATSANNFWFCRNKSNNYKGVGYSDAQLSPRNNGSTVRCFRDSTNANLEIDAKGGKQALITIIKEGNVSTIDTIKEPIKKTTDNIDLVFSGWYTTSGYQDGTKKVEGSTLSASDTALYARWDCPNGLIYDSSNNQCVSLHNVYTVIFENWDGFVLWSGEVVAGETPNYTGSTPSRSSTEQVVYNFNGWYPELSPVTGNITYTATYTESPRLYTVTLTGTPAGYGTLSTGPLLKEYGAAIVISGDKLRVGGTEVTLSGNEGYEFQEWTGTCGKVEKQACDEHIIYSHPEPIEFTGGNNLIITNEGYDLFSESNYQKDFEISFDIVDQNLSSSVNQATILNVKDEDQENIYPGIAIRKSSSAGKIEITATSNYGKGYKTNKDYSLENLHSIKISRINSILYVSINGSENEQLYDYSGFNTYFTKPIVFGSSYKDEDHLLRPAKITLSNILIKTVDTCHTGNVYVVTGDCQMTAKFKEIEKHPDVTVNHHWMNIGGSGYTIHETQHFTGNIGDEFTAIENEYIGFTANPENEKTIIISGDNNSNVIDLYYFRNYGYFHFLYDPFSVRNIITSCEHGDCWYGEDIQLTVVEGSGYAFNSWGEPYGISLPEGVDRTSKTISFTMPEMTQQQIKWSLSLSAIPYTITYHLNGGEETTHNQTGYTVQNPIIEVIDPVMTGYEFLGWTGGIIGGEQLDSPTTGLVIVVDDGVGNIKLGNREYYANWTPNKYEVTGSVAEGQENMGYLSGSTSTGASLTGLYDFGTNLIFIAIPELGYVFDYWKNGDTVLSGTDLGDGTNQLTVVVNQILDIIAFFKPAENTPYTVEHYKQNLDQTGYEFAWSGTMYGTTNGLTNATGTDYEGFTLSGDLVGYQTGVKADGSTVVKLYYNRNTYTVTRNMWEGHLNRRKIDKNVPYGTTPIFEWDDEDKYTPKRGREVDTDDIKYDFIFTGWIKSGSTEIIKDLTMQIVTGNVTYTAQYDTEYRYYEVRYHTDEGIGTMEPQSLQLYSSGTLNKNKFIRTGYIFSGWWYEYSDGIEVFYEDEQEINLGVEDGVLKSGGEWEDPLYLDVYAQWKPSTGTKIKVNCYARELDKNLKELSPEPKYLTGTEHTGKTDSGINVIDYSWECMNISGYNIGHGVSGAIIYGSDFPNGILTGWDGTTTILADGSRVINVYIAPKIDSFIINESDNCGYKGDPSGYYYYGSKIYLEADPYECYSFSGWSGSGLPDGFDRTSAITEFFMPHAIVVNLTPTVRENKYNIVFSGNGSTSGTMSDLSVLCTSGTLSQNTFEREGYTFAGRSTTSTGTVEFSDESEVYRLNTEDNGSATLYAVWNINNYEVTGSIAEGQENMGYLSGNTGTGISLTGLYDYGTELIFIAVPELGYLFDYWEVTGSGDSQPIVTESGNQLTVIVDQILDIIAHFTENVKTVTINYYEMNTGGVYPNAPYNTDSFTGLVGQTKSINPESRLGFHLDSDRSNTGVTISENSEDNVINIYYARDKHYITLGYSGAFVYPNSVEVVPAPSETGYYYGESVHFEAIVSTGYVFKQWKVNGNPVAGNADGVDFVVGTNDINLIVDGDPISYHIFYHGIGGSDYPDNPNYYTALSGMFSIIDPVKTGYTFLGWTGGVTGDWISTPTSGLTIDVTNGLGDREYYANWETHEKNIVVNYYEMDTSGNYIYDPNHDYPNEHYYYTGLVDSTFTVPDYSKTGFSFQYSIFRGNTGYNEPVTFEVSENDSENIINVYYQRARNSLQIYSNNGSKYDVGPNCQSYDGGYTHSCSYYYGTEIAINNYIYEYDEGYSFSGWNIDSEYSLPDDAYLSNEHINFSMPDHSVIIRLETNHILYKLTFTGYEGAEVMNYDSTYVSLTGENYYRFDSEIELPYLDKPGYNFIGWNSGDYNIWSIYYSSNPNHPIRHMPSHDVELTAVFEPKTDMEYNEYYYLQDVEGTGYSRDDELTQRKYDGTTEQQIPYPYPQKYITGFEYTGFGYDEKALRPWEEWPIIKATGDNYINYYYDRKVDGVYVEYDNKKMFITGTGEYRYGAPVNLIAVVKTGYEFSGFTSYQGELLSSGSVYNFTMPDSYVYLYADANPIVYSIDYEMNGGYFVPYNWAKTGYTVDGDFDLDIFDAGKEGYTFLGWTGGVIGVRELTEPTTGLIIPLGSTGNRKYFANFEATGSNVTVNYYLKKIDPENNVLTGGVDEYISKGVVYTGLTDSVVDISALYGTGIEGYEYTTAIVYGSDSMSGIETGTTTILGDGTRSIDIYYTPKKYNFTVIQGQNTTTAGTSISTGYYFGAYVTLSGDSTEACFGWDKWGSSDLPEGKNQQHTTFEMPAHNVTVESMVSEKSYNIVFDANGGTGTMSTLSVQCTSGTLSANNFERNGYTFTGWSRNSDGPVEFTGESDIHRLSTESGETVNLYAIWDINHYTVTFDLNEGKLTGDMTLTTGYTIETPAISLTDYIPYKSGYIFTGWYRGESLVNSIAGGETGDYTLTANWEAQDQAVMVFDYLEKLDGGYDTIWNKPILAKVDSFFDAPIKSYTGFKFDETNPENITGRIVSWDVGQNELKVFYSRLSYPVIVRNVGKGISSMTTGGGDYLYEEPVTINVKPFTGWEFLNWTLINGSLDGVDLNQQTLSFNMPAEEIKISPNLNHIEYTVSFDAGLGTSIESQTYYYDDLLSGLNSAITTRSGYSFSGWYLGNLLYTADSKMPAESITLTAKWKAETGIQYQVNHRGENIEGTAYDVLLLNETKYGETDARTLANSGEFEGFTLSGDVEQKKISPSGTTVVDIYYSRNKYLITFKDGDGNVIQTGMVAYGDTPIYSGDTPTKTATAQYSYTFNDLRSPSIENVTTGAIYTAQFDAALNSYSATISSNNTDFGTVSPASVTGLYGSTIEINGNVLTISGQNVVASPKESTAQYTYTFSGWNNTCGDEITGNCTITAEFTRTVNEYLITFVDGDGKTIQTGTLAYGEIPEYTGATPTKTATAQYTYTFNNTWSPAVEQVTTGVTYTAQFDSTVNEYLITFVDGDGKTIQSGMVAYGETPVYSESTPTKTATAQYTYTFNNTWTPTIESVTTGATYTAQFDSTLNTYTIIFVDDDATELYSQVLEFGETPVYSGATPRKTGHTFTGWAPETSTVSGDTTYTAIYSVNQYKITFIKGNGEEDYIISGDYDSSITAPDEPTRNGYTFMGWDRKIPSKMPAENLTITAQWEEHEIYGPFKTSSNTPFRIALFTSGADAGKIDLKTTKFANGGISDEILAQFLLGSDAPTTPEGRTELFNNTAVEIVNIDDLGGDVLFLKFPKDEIYSTKGYCSNEGCSYFASEGSPSVTGEFKQEAMDTSNVQGPTWATSATNYIKYNTVGDSGYVVLVSKDGVNGYVYVPIMKYTIKWNVEGVDVETYIDVKYGTMPNYDGATPEKQADAQYTYTFREWSPEVKSVTGNTTYTAQFDSTVNKYLITFVDGDGKTIQTGMVAYGETPVYSGSTPTKTATAQYTYTFREWSPEIKSVTGDTTYTAQFDSTVNEYLITFVDGDGKTIQSGMVAYGETPVYSGSTPTKTATAQYTYTFNNTWTPTIESVTTGATYTAQFDPTVNEYTVSIVPSDTDMGTVSPSEIDVNYGATIVESGNTITIGGVTIEAIPNPADVQYTYEFDSWTNTCGSELVGTCTIQANFKKILNKYNITWKDDNGNVIDTTMVEYGATPTHSKPTKPETEDYRYVFVGWMPELVAVTGDAEYTATFTAEEKEKPSKGGSMSGGGGRKSSIDDVDNSDNQHGSAEENSDLFTGDYYTSSGNIDDETLSLYEWAHENDITTIDTFVEANADGYLTRGHMAKMAVKFAEIVLGKTVPDTYPAECNWNDKESERESQEIKIYAKKACALGVMGINVDEFMPNKILNRAEFGTTVSRLLWGNKYNITDTDHRSYYEDHLYALKKQGIMTQINDPEDRRELRKWVRLVFRRITEKFK